MKEIIIKIKLIYKARSVMKTDWKYNIKNYTALSDVKRSAARFP